MKKALIPESMQVTVFALFVLLLYVVALVYPDNWWGFHYPAFLSSGRGWVIVLLAVGMLPKTVHHVLLNVPEGVMDPNLDLFLT